MFKNKRPIYSKSVDEVSKICSTCRYASPMSSTEDYMCEKKGLVARDFYCKHYFYNHLMKRPPQKRNLASDRFSPEDFSID